MFKKIIDLLINKEVEETVIEDKQLWTECKQNNEDLMIQLLGQDAYTDMKDHVQY